MQTGRGRFPGSERGVSSLEYAILGSLIAVVIIAAVALLGGSAQTLWLRVADCIGNPQACGQ